MSIELTSEIIERLVTARKQLHLTQLELHLKSKISERTIKDLETGRRTSFNEDTLIRLCRALGLDYNEILGPTQESGMGHSGRKRVVVWGAVAALALVIAGIGYSNLRWTKGEYQRKDWIIPERVTISHFNPDWPPDVNGFVVNYFHIKQPAYIGSTLRAEFKWSYHFTAIKGKVASTPEYCINAFAQWDPDREIPLFEGVLNGEGSDTLNFEVLSPQDAGLYAVRVFFASAFAPVSSYYTRPPPNQLSEPCIAPCLEIPIEVLPK